MDRNVVRSFSDAHRTPRSSRMPDSPHTPTQQDISLTTPPSATRSEPKSELLRQKLRQRREGLPDRPSQPDLTHTAPQTSKGLADYVFESDEDDKKQRRRSRLNNVARSASAQLRITTPSKMPNYERMGSKDIQAEMTKLNNANWDLKLRVCLTENKNRKLEEELADARDKLASVYKLEQEKDGLQDDNAKLRKQVKDLQTTSSSYQASLLVANNLQRELLVELDRREAKLNEANGALNEALEMILDLERKVDPLEQELAKYKASPYHSGSQDSTYFSNEPDTASVAVSADELSRPPTFPVLPPATSIDTSSTHRSYAHSVSELTRPLTRRINTLVRTMSVDTDRANELRYKVSTGPGINEASSPFNVRSLENIVNVKRPRLPLRNFSNPGTRRPSEVRPSSPTTIASASTGMRRPSNQTIRQTSDSHDGSRMSVASDASGSRGLRSLYLKGERAKQAEQLPTQAPAVQDINTPNAETATFLHDLSVASADQPRSVSRTTTSFSSWDSYHPSDYEAETESIAEPPESIIETDDEYLEDSETVTVKRHSIDSQAEEPVTPTMTEVSEIPTEYRPGQYPKWPGTEKPHFGMGRDMFFNGEGLDEIPRTRK